MSITLQAPPRAEPSRLGSGEARLRWWLSGPRSRDLLWGWLGPLLVAVLAGVLRFWNLGRPHQLVFDETYYVKQAYTLLVNGYENQWPKDADQLFTAGQPNSFLEAPDRTVHPPVGKWMIAFGEWLFGIDSSVGWRFSAALVGTLMVLILARTARRMFGSTLLGCTAGLLLAVDSHHLVMSRTGILDIFLAFWVLCAFSLLVLDRDHARDRIAHQLSLDRSAVAGLGPWFGVRPLRLAAAVCLGLACGVKWSGLYFLAAFCLLTVFWDYSARRALGVRQPWWGMVVKDGIPAALTMLPVAVLTYLATWIPWMASDRSYFRQWGAENPSDTWVPDVLRSLWHYHADMWQFHTTLSSTHPYMSKPWAWLFNTRPTSFFYEGPKQGEDGCTVELCSKAITSVGNPIVWWGAALSIGVLVVVWMARRDWRAGAILMAFAAGWAPWFLYPERTIYSFYAVAFVPYLVLALTFVLGMILGGPGMGAERRMWGAAVAGGIVVLAVLVLAFFWPVLTAEVIPNPAWQTRMWLPSWV
ncbi:MAG: dolichyl-phosphate-mannose--protein mannosyltransferase [Actinomycetales bacterium]